jgi:hypothetical protein
MKRILFLLLMISVLLLGASIYERRIVPVGNPSFVRHSIAASHFSMASSAVLMVYSGLIIAWRWRENSRQRSAALGLCTKCGYDLRATPARCPECGAIPTKTKTISS